MVPKLVVSQSAINRLMNVKEVCIGNLYGVLYKNTLIIIGFYIRNDDLPGFMHGFPTEVDMYGIVEIHNGQIKEEEIRHMITDIDVTDTPLYVSRKLNNNSNNIEAYFNINNCLEKVPFEVVTEYDIYSQFVHIRLMSQLPYMSGTTPESIKDSFTSLCKQLANGQIVFNFPKTSIYLMGNDCENGLIGLTGNPTVGEICKESTGITEGCAPNYKKKKNQNLEMDILPIIMFKKVTREHGVDNTKMHAPVVHIDKRAHQSLQFIINIDTLSLVHKEKKVVDLYNKLIESCCRYLRLLEGIIVNNVQDCDYDYSKISKPETYHFFPDNCGHFITRTYNENDTEESLESSRRIMHQQLVLPFNRPIFRRTNRFVFKGNLQENGPPLINPHEGIAQSGNDGEIAIVRGKYSYYHYCQNKMDDNGWGCAYRSLQTLASWFRWQGYTSKEVPTFIDIQKCLVDIGDKPTSFIGSRQWIGSTEVNFVLNSIMDITSKIIYVSSGEDMPAKGPELINHFKIHGSPIMIGGGVLAHTILGVDYNSVTGDIKFLILDPHYTGVEDLDIILKKGWCSWKGTDFWNKTVYYNMCLPQVPHCI